MKAYYNEFDENAAAWLRELIARGHIAPGDVDTRSIEDVRPDDLRGYAQCHFFAGIGVWSYALRKAGWADDRPVWTGSCPCQPFSAAGKGAAFADERHLWPAFHHLIAECRPAAVLGEQVASSAVDEWIDLVHADLEAVGYAFGSVPFPSAGVGAPHIRDRNYWVAHAEKRGRREERAHAGWRTGGDRAERIAAGSLYGGVAGGMADTDGGHTSAERQQRGGEQRQQPQDGSAMRLADAEPQRHDGGGATGAANGTECGRSAAAGRRNPDAHQQPGPTNGFWRDADWLGCTDGKWRPVSPKPQPLADGSAESMGRVCASIIKEIEEEINVWSMENKIDRTAALRNLLEALGAESHACWSAGRVPGLHEAPFLLAFVRQLQEQGWGVAQRLPLQGSENAEAVLRMLRNDGPEAGTPRQHGLDGQQPRECTNAVHFLSSLLARYAHKAWYRAHRAYAETAHPLAHGAESRVIRLRGYGNAINAGAAQTWIETVMECL